MAIKKYTSGAWVPTIYRKYGTETDTITSLPAQIIGDGQPITSCQISGNVLQNGTPTPDSPVDVVGCGVRTENLFNINRTQSNTFTLDASKWFVGAATTSAASQNANCTVSDGKISVESFTGGHGACFMIPVTGQTDYVLTFDADKISSGSYVGYSYRDANGDILYTSTIGAKSEILTTYPNTRYIDICFRCPPADGEVVYSKIMLNTGSTPLQYEPYGFKLPLAVNGTEYPIYLGEVPTTRRIKKLVLTGEETWWSSGTYAGAVYAYHSQFPGIKPLTYLFCTHLVDASVSSYAQGTCKNDENSVCLWMFGTTTSPTAFKSYLAAQYAAGTPVTIWYVLATPETGIVNEPLHKIGGYADTVTVTSIPTTGTPESFDIGTTLKPSEVQLTYHGWHEHADTKYTE